MKEKTTIPTICTHCKWFNALGCMCDEELRDELTPDFQCFEPLDNPSYPPTREINDKFFDLFYTKLRTLEHAFISRKGIYNDGTVFISVLSRIIELLEESKKEFLKLQEAFRKYPKTYEDVFKYFN